MLHCLPHPQRPQADQAALLSALGGLWAAGVAIDWGAFYAGQERRRLALPTYPFQRRRYWIDPPGAAAPAGAAADPVADWFYLPAWRPLDPPPSPATAAGRWLLFCDAQGLGEALAARLERDGRSVARVIPGDGMRRLAPGRYTLVPDHPEDYAALLADLEAAPDAVVHLWTLGAPAEGETERGFYSLLALTRALGGLDDRPRALTMVSSHLQAAAEHDAPCPERALLLGPVRVAPLEYPRLRCRSLDLSASGPWDDAATVDRLLAECADPQGPALIAWRDGRRLGQDFEPARWPRAGLPARLRQGGVYLITGGLGSMGLAFAEHLHRRAGARLALLARELPSDSRAGLARLETSLEQELALPGPGAWPGVEAALDRYCAALASASCPWGRNAPGGSAPSGRE